MAVLGICAGLLILLIIATFFAFAPPGIIEIPDLVKIFVVILIPVGAAVLAGLRHFLSPDQQEDCFEVIGRPNKAKTDEPCDEPKSR